MKRIIVASQSNIEKSEPEFLRNYYNTEATYREVKSVLECTTSEIIEEEMEYLQLGYVVYSWIIAKDEYFNVLNDSNLAVIPIVSEQNSSNLFPAEMVNGRVYDVTDEIKTIVEA